MARPKYPSDDIDKSMVRFPPGLMDRIKDAAAKNHRSMNAEIIARLEASFAGGAANASPELKEGLSPLLRAMAEQLNEERLFKIAERVIELERDKSAKATPKK